jgi:hypothetical protein
VRLAALAALPVLAAVGAGGAAWASTPAQPPRAALGTHLQVTAVEYRLLLSRGVVHAGPVSLEEIDAGMDPHDLRLRHGHSTDALAEPELQPGQRWDGVVDLAPGVYHLWCALPGHWKLGMRATLRVVR